MYFPKIWVDLALARGSFGYIISMKIFHEYLVETDLPVSLAGLSSRMMRNSVNNNMKVNRFKLIVGMSRGWIIESNPLSFLNIFPIVKNLVDSYISQGNTQISLDVNLPADKTFADHAKTFFAGLFGYGMTSIYAESRGAVWFAHFEEVKRLSIITHPIGKAMPSQTPDLVSLDTDGVLAWLESKGSLSSSGDIWSSHVTKGFKEQIIPWIGGSINGTTVFHGRAVGTHISLTGNKLLSVYVDYPAKAGGSHYPMALLRPHYSRWLRLFGGSFWPLAVRLGELESSRDELSLEIDYNIVSIGSLEFVVNIANGPYCITPCFEGRPIYLGLERRIFDSIIELVRNPESAELQAASIAATVNEISDVMKTIDGIFGNENDANSREINNYGLEGLVNLRQTVDMCAFVDGTIAFHGAGSSLLINN